MTSVSRCQVAPGSGTLARRERAVLYLPDDAPTQFTDHFVRCGHHELIDLLTAHVLDAPVVAAPFVFVDWPSATDASPIRLLVRGDIEVAGDLGSTPVLSGVGSDTWVEHRVTQSRNATHLHCGAPVVADTDLRDGVVTAGGFTLQLATQGPTRAPDPTGDERRLDRIASLEAAVGGDWMEESLQLERAPTPPREQVAPRSAPDGPTVPPNPPTPTDAPMVELPDGTRHRVTGTLVLGRRPDAASARAPGGATIAFDAAASVSRTHLRLSFDGQQLHVTDCASSGGTILHGRAGGESVRLRPWVARTLREGDRLSLGGTETSLLILDGRTEQPRTTPS